jgi:hypothetical protein
MWYALFLMKIVNALLDAIVAFVDFTLPSSGPFLNHAIRRTIQIPLLFSRHPLSYWLLWVELLVISVRRGSECSSMIQDVWRKFGNI